MKINLSKAISIFYPNPAYEQVYFEAVANAIDARADEISIHIDIDSFDTPDTLKLTIKDNGIGFSDKNFEKFSSLLEVENNKHKGLGRLVYLAYFNEVKIESIYNDKEKREFIFNNKFSGQSKKIKIDDLTEQKHRYGSILRFSGFHKKMYTYAYLTPQKIKDSLIEQFFPLLFRKKESGESLKIVITLDVVSPNLEKDFFSDKVILSLDNLPKLKKTTFEDKSIDLFKSFDIYYSIDKDILKSRSIYTAVCIDDRALEYDLISIESIPHGYQLKFLFVSDYFTGKTNASRQKLYLPDELTEKNLKGKLREEIGKVINEAIPNIAKQNHDLRESLNNHFPHLQGYFPISNAGLLLKQTVLEEARNKFFSEQQKILECEHLDDAQYEKALEMSSRALAEYVMYRVRIISKLKDVTEKDKEDVLHNLIVPMRKTLKEEGFDDDIYSNNVWILDDRFMSYNTILSDEFMEKIIQEITLDEVQDTSRPDIIIVFSGNPNEMEKVSVVVVELKKLGLPVKRNNDVLYQLKEKAKMLLKYFPNKIERIWFYGVTDIDSKFRISLKEDGFKELFSHGQMFFKPQDIILDENDTNPPSEVDLFVMTYESLINDAESRNEAFLKILKSTIRKSSWSSLAL